MRFFGYFGRCLKGGVIGLLTFFAFLPNVQAAFVSLHQIPITYLEKIIYHPGGGMDIIRTAPLYGFKDQFAPFGVSGCVIGYPEYRPACDTVEGGFGFLFPDYTSVREVKVYIPPGIKFFSFSGFLPQNENFAVAVKLDSPPSRMSPLNSQEYIEVKRVQNSERDFGFLLDGEERLMVHSGGGHMTLSGVARFYAEPLQSGHWLYVRVLNGSSMYNLKTNYEVDRDIYLKWYEDALHNDGFSANGDPVEGGSIPPVNPPLNAITVSPASWIVGTSPVPSIRITAEPANAKIKMCQVKDAKYSDILKFSNFTGSTVSGSINTVLAQTLPSGNHEIEFTCDGKDGKFTINKPVIDPTDPTEGTVTFSNGRTNPGPGEFKGEYEMTMSLDLTSEKIQAGDKVTYWVAALIPFYGPMLPPPDQNWANSQVPFFLGLTKSGSERKRMWRLVHKEDKLADSVYEKDVSPINGKIENIIQLYISKEGLEDLDAEIVVGYKITRGSQEGPIKAASGFWKPDLKSSAPSTLQ